MSDILKECKKHGLTKFFKNWPNKCKRCNTESVIRRRREIKRLLVQFAGGKCVKCGYNKCVGALEFHHKDPSQKDFGIAELMHKNALEKLKEEVKKCDLICANCHDELHYNLTNQSG